jgi:hypothetical protein
MYYTCINLKTLYTIYLFELNHTCTNVFVGMQFETPITWELSTLQCYVISIGKFTVILDDCMTSNFRVKQSRTLFELLDSENGDIMLVYNVSNFSPIDKA